MITCPNPSCNQKLPDFVQTCQFCGQDLTSVRRPHSDDPVTGSGMKKEHVWTIYYLLCAFMLLTGIWGVVDDVAISVGSEGMDTMNYVGVIFSVVQIMLAIGMFMRLEWARGLVNFWCWVGIVFTLLGLGLLIMAMLTVIGGVMPTGLLILSLFLSLLDLAVYGGVIWVIGETDRYGYR